MMENISNRALISRLFSSAEQYLREHDVDMDNWSQWYQLVQNMTGPEKMVYVIVKLNQEVTSGGFAQFYEHSFGIFAPEIAHALSEIGAQASADIVAGTLQVINPAGLLDEAYKTHVFKMQISPLQKQQLYAEDVQYDGLHDVENLEDLLGNYLQAMIRQ